MKVSIVLPTYNRAKFLPGAIDSILGQTFVDWELVIADDGSTDGTREVVDELRPRIKNPVRYFHQANAGAGPARNLGLEHATGEYVAFFDSDDLWRPEFLEKGVRALDENPCLDWVSCDASRVDAATGRVLQENHYFASGKPRPFLELHAQEHSDLRIIDDDRFLECAMRDGLVCLVQASVVRRSVFDGIRFWMEYRVIEDRFLVLQCIAQGIRFGYRQDTDVLLQTHDEHVSLVGESRTDTTKRARIYRDEVEAWLRFSREVGLAPRHRDLARQLAATNCFWNLGYVTYWMVGYRQDALEAFRRALSIRPWSLAFWKTYLSCSVRTMLARSWRMVR